MDLSIQIWITGWICGSLYPGMDYMMNIWIYVSRYGLQDGSMYPGMDYRMGLWIFVSGYGLQDEYKDLCIQVWIIGCIYGSMYPGMDYRMDLWNYGSMYPGVENSLESAAEAGRRI